MKYICFIVAIGLCAIKAKAQNILVDTVRTQGKEVLNNARLEKEEDRKAPAGMVPPVIIILNYERVIKPQELANIKKTDIAKQYFIENKLGVGEVERVMIVETRDRNKYKK